MMKEIKASAAAAQAAKIRGYATGGAVREDDSVPTSAVVKQSRSSFGGGLSGLEGAPAKTRLDRKGPLKSGKAGDKPIQVAGGTDALALSLVGVGALTGAAIDAKVRGADSVAAQVSDKANEPMPPPDETGMVRPFLLPFGYDAQKQEPALVWPNVVARPVLDAKKSWDTGEMPSPGEALGIAGVAMPGAIAGRTAKSPNSALADELMKPQRGTMEGTPNVYQKPGPYHPNEIKSPTGANVVPEPPSRAAASVDHLTPLYDQPGDRGQSVINRIGSNRANMPIFTDTNRFAPHYQAEIKGRVGKMDAVRRKQYERMAKALKKADQTE